MMIPKIQLKEGKDTFTRLEVEEMLNEVSNSFQEILSNEVAEFKFAKNISYLCLIVSTLILVKDVFFK